MSILDRFRATVVPPQLGAARTSSGVASKLALDTQKLHAAYNHRMIDMAIRMSHPKLNEWYERGILTEVAVDKDLRTFDWKVVLRMNGRYRVVATISDDNHMQPCTVDNLVSVFREVFTDEKIIEIGLLK